MSQLAPPPPVGPVPVASLSRNQEQRLVEYLEDQFLEIARSYKKRTLPTTTLPTLPSYINATRPLLSLILQIPPGTRSARHLRTTFMLRLMGEVLGAVVGYPLSDGEVVREVLDYLDDLDKACVLVLQGQVWDPNSRSGVDVFLPSSSDQTDNMSQTERTRLRSLLVCGSTNLEDWVQEAGDWIGEETLREFGGIFEGTLREIGGLDGIVSVADPDGMVGTC